MADVSVRPAVVADAWPVASVQLRTWQAAYRAVLPAAVLATPVEALAEAWARSLAGPPTSSHRALVALAGNEIVGFVAVQPADAAEAPGAAELAALLVDPAAGRRGHGSRLLAACADTWRADGVGLAVAWLWGQDDVSLTFLRSAGWGEDGARRVLDTGEDLHTQVRLRTALGGR